MDIGPSIRKYIIMYVEKPLHCEKMKMRWLKLRRRCKWRQFPWWQQWWRNTDAAAANYRVGVVMATLKMTSSDESDH